MTVPAGLLFTSDPTWASFLPHLSVEAKERPVPTVTSLLFLQLLATNL